MTSSTERIRRYTITEDGGRQNIFAHEPEITVNESYDYWKNAEVTNGRLAMIGLVALFFNYTVFGWVIPGIV
tara:strand:+ start:12679 stop:12894 length:216 start_codon:yes stop_codon:yes gene_type:complete